MKNQITVAIILTVAFIAALYLGTTVASGDIVTLSAWVGVTLVVFFVVKGYKIAWQTILFIAWGNISFLLAFRIEPIHAAAVIFGLFVVSATFRGIRLPAMAPLKRAGIIPLNIAIAIFLLYGFFHLGVCRVMPQIPGEFNLGNSAKAYFKAFAPLAILLFGLNSRMGFQVRRGWLKGFVYVMTFAVVGNVSYLVYLYLKGFSSMTDRVGVEEIGMLYIPLINAAPHHFAMRTLGPLATLFGFGIVSIPGWWREQSGWLRIAVLILIVGGLGGAVMSGGRAALAMCFLFIGLIALYRKKITLIIFSMMGAFLAIIIANIFSGFINEKAPMFVARPLQYFMLEKGTSMDTINNSQDQRNGLFEAAIDEWKSDPRIMGIGRGVYRYVNSFDDLRPTLGEKGAFIEVNLRAGTCHSLIPSALIQYGVIGLILYLIIWFYLLRFNWKLYKIQKRDGYSQGVQTVTICLLVYQSLRIVIDLVAAGWLSIFSVTMLLLIRSRMAHEVSQYEEEHLIPEAGAGQTIGSQELLQNHSAR
ncbi:hypothetical protein N8Z81_04805 [Akkermansiaceae bacterium]|nr:hypothetical protein [Akkermansiaceae bacterium]